MAFALGATLAGMGVAVCTGAPADAIAVAPISLSVASLSTPSTSPVALSTPAIGVSVPGVGVSTPGVGVSVGGAEVSVGEATVSVPGASVTTPKVGVSVSTAPEASAPVPPTTSPPTPTTGAPSPTPGATPSSTATGSGGSVTVSQRHPTAASSPAAGATQQPSLAGAAAHPSTMSKRSASAVAPQRRGKGSLVGPTVTGKVTLTAVQSRSTLPAGPSRPHARADRHAAGNPLDAIGRHIPLPLPVPDWSKPIILALLLLAISLGIRSRLTTLRARRLEGQRTTLLRDLGATQAALVPDVPAHIGGLAVSVAYRPADGPAAGGDFYDVFVPEPGKVAIILGDVAGHGHQALAQAALTRYTLRAYVQAGLEPRAALALTGRVLADPTLEHFATVAVAVYHTQDRTLTYATAGHPHPILCGFPEHRRLEVCASPPIGWTVPTGRCQTTRSLPPGAVVCFFSDGLTEARRDDELLGCERLSEIVAALGAQPAAAELLQQVTAAATATPDDMAACILMLDAETDVAAVHIEEVEADGRALGRHEIPRFLQSCGVPAPAIARAMSLAGDIAARSGTAVLRVELSTTPATVTVLRSDRTRPTIYRRPPRLSGQRGPRATLTT